MSQPEEYGLEKNRLPRAHEAAELSLQIPSEHRFLCQHDLETQDFRLFDNSSARNHVQHMLHIRRVNVLSAADFGTSQSNTLYGRNYIHPPHEAPRNWRWISPDRRVAGCGQETAHRPLPRSKTGGARWIFRAYASGCVLDGSENP